MKTEVKKAWKVFISTLLGLGTYCLFFVFLVTDPLRAVAVSIFIVAVNLHMVGLKLVK